MNNYPIVYGVNREFANDKYRILLCHKRESDKIRPIYLLY
jgi:hypothetical protein